MFIKFLLVSLVVMLGSTTVGDLAHEQRDWSDATGHYFFKAELVIRNDNKVVLQKENGELIAIPIEQLSVADRSYIESLDASESPANEAGVLQEWELNNGIKLAGRLVDFVEKDWTIRRYVGKLYVGDQKLEEMPKAYRDLVPSIAAYFDNAKIDSESALEEWIKKQPQGSRTFQCNGVLVELDNGGRYAVPLFMFSEADATALQAGWQRWQTALEEKRREEESFYLRAQSNSRSWRSQGEPDHQTETDVHKLRQVAELSLQLQAYDAGLFDLWEVLILPPAESWALRQYVIVPGRDSEQAAQAALQNHPDYRIGAIAKLRRRR